MRSSLLPELSHEDSSTVTVSSDGHINARLRSLPERQGYTMMRCVAEKKALSDLKPTRSISALESGLSKALSVGTRKRKQFCPVLIFFWDLASTPRTVRDYCRCVVSAQVEWRGCVYVRARHLRLRSDQLGLVVRPRGRLCRCSRPTWLVSHMYPRMLCWSRPLLCPQDMTDAGLVLFQQTPSLPDRGDYYEDPLDELRATHLPCQVPPEGPSSLQVL